MEGVSLNKKILYRLSLLTFSIFTAAESYAIQVSIENDSDVLANSLAGAGISVFDTNFVGDNLQGGLFTDGFASGFGIDSGVIFSSGSVLDASGPNDSDSQTTGFGNPGSAELSELAGFPTFDLASLSFDFQFDNEMGGDLVFSLVFGSEEYNEFVNSQFNDVFSFSIDGVNQAVLDDGSNITINSINNNVNSDLFVDNTSGIFDTQLDGFTNLLTFTVNGLDAGIHQAEFSIADSSDSVLDSWVLIGAESFVDSDVVAVPELNSKGASLAILFIISMLLLLAEKATNGSRLLKLGT